jgi:hypothetical protein
MLSCENCGNDFDVELSSCPTCENITPTESE